MTSNTDRVFRACVTFIAYPPWSERTIDYDSKQLFRKEAVASSMAPMRKLFLDEH